MICEVSFELAQRAVRYVQNHHLKVDRILFNADEEKIVYLEKSGRIVTTSDYNPNKNFGK